MDKPFLSFQDQLRKLEVDYKLTIIDRDFALMALSTVSYYDLINGYKSLFMINNEFMPGISMEFLFSTHMYNKSIQGVLFKYSMYAENSFKTILSYIISEKYGVLSEEYLHKRNYKFQKDSFNKKRMNELLHKLSETCRVCKDTPTSHYRLTKNHIPPWILFRNVSFSDVSNLFDFLKPDDKTILISYFDAFHKGDIDLQEAIRTMKSCLTIVRKFRNQIAHNLTFMDYRCVSLRTAANRLFEETLVARHEIDKTRDDIWSLIISMVILLNNKFLIYNFLTEFNSYMLAQPELIETYCHFTGIPKDFDRRIVNYLGI